MSGTVRIAILANGAQARQELQGVGREGARLGQTLKTGLAVGAGIAGAAIAKTFVDGVKAAEDYVTMQRRTAAVIKSTGNAARISVKGVAKLAGEIEGLTGVDENLIINSQNVLATFTKVRNGIGKSNKVFDRATRAAVDMSAALGTDLKGSTIQLGKALNDPIKGITALSRSGVSFTEEQKKQIKTLVESGDVLKAQKLILAEVEKEFGGAAKAAGGEGFTGALNRAKDSLGDLTRDLLTVALPGLTTLADGFTNNVVPAIRGFAEGVRDRILPAVRTAFGQLSRFTPKIDLKGALAGIVRQVKGWGKPVVDAFTAGVKTGDYGPLGTALGEALRQAISGAAGLASKVFGAIGDWAASVDWLQIGKKVGGKALPFVIGFVNALFDPLFTKEFWSKNWQEVLLFAVAFIPFGKAGSLATRVAKGLGFEKGITGGIIKGLEGTIGAVGRAVLDFVGFVGKTLLKGFRLAFPEVNTGFKRWLDDVILRVWYAAEGVGPAIKAFFERMLIEIGRAVGRVIVAAGKIAFQIIKALTAPIRAAVGLLREPISFIFRIWADEFVRGVRFAAGWGRSIVGGLGRGLGSVIRNLLTPIRQGLQLILENLATWPGRFYARGVAAVNRLGAAIRTAGAKFKGILFEAGQNVMSSFLSGLQSFYTNNVKPFLNSITSKLPFEKGPPAKDKRILTPAGQLVMRGFLTGLEDGYGAVRTSLNAFTASLPSIGSAGTLQAGQLAAPTLAVAASPASAQQLQVGFDPASINAAMDPLARAWITFLREVIRVQYGGDVRRALSQPGK